MIKHKYRVVTYHLIFWVIYILLNNILTYAQDPKSYIFNIGDIFIFQIPNICTVYLCILACRKYTNPLKPFSLFLGITIVFAFSYLLWYTTTYHIRPYVNANGSTPAPFNFINYGAAVLLVFIRYSIIGIGYHFASEGIKRERKLRLIEKEKHEAEYAFLRAQINPHFLNNTLNFFFAKSLPLSQELADGIMTLSKIMRYSLEMDKDDRMTLIDEEIEHIKNVIKINQLRFNNKLQIDFSVNGSTDNVRLIPLILITIVENILKHGDCTDNLHPVKIALSINEIDHHIHLSTWNRKKKGPKELSSGIGMENIRKRLANHYKKGAALNINETEIDYSLELTLPYNKVTDHQEKPSSFDNLGFLEHFKLSQINPQPYTS